MKTPIDIETISSGDILFHSKNNWCASCKQADTGIDNLQFYIEDGVKFVRGNCLICSSECVTKITEIYRK